VVAARSRNWVRVIGAAGAVALVVVGIAITALFVYFARANRAACTDYRGRALAEVTATTTELGRSLVRTSADAYRIRNCEGVLGPLPDPDPDAYRPAPTPGR
jgi:capsid protein